MCVCVLRTVQALLGQRKRKRRALQDYEAFVDYFDEADWAVLSSTTGYIHKKAMVLAKLEKLGLTNPKEMTVKKINSFGISQSRNFVLTNQSLCHFKKG